MTELTQSKAKWHASRGECKAGGKRSSSAMGPQLPREVPLLKWGATLTVARQYAAAVGFKVGVAVSLKRSLLTAGLSERNRAGPSVLAAQLW